MKILANASLCGLLVIAGCATIIQGTKQDVAISSSPTGARITVDNIPRGRTPVIAHLTRKDSHILTLELPGYQPFELSLARGVSGWVAGNIVFGGLIGLAVDAISGGMYKLTPDQVSAELLTTAEDGDELLVMVVLHPQPGWERIGTLTGEMAR